MNHLIEPIAKPRGDGRATRWVVAMAALALGGTAWLGQAGSSPVPAEGSSASMQQFALLFRPGSTPLSESDQKRRADAVLQWARQQNEAGRKLDPRALGREHRWIGPDSGGDAGAPRDVGSLSNILFLEARDFAEAVEVARTHPGLQFGASVEVRAWARPQGRPPAFM